MLEGESAHHGNDTWTAARNFDDPHASAIANNASKRGTTLLSLESVL
jgi:hypothetical protein